MEYWIIVDDHHAGPYVIEQLEMMAITPESPVWHEGLTDWVPASSVPELAAMFERRAAAAVGCGNVQDAQPAPVNEPEAAESNPQQQPGDPQPMPQDDGQYQQPADQAQQQQWQPAGPTVWQWQQQSAPPCDEPCPPAYLAWAIIVTILCCTPLGIAGIIFAAQVKQAYNRGDLAKAKKFSEWTQWMIILAIVLGLISLPLQIMMLNF